MFPVIEDTLRGFKLVTFYDLDDNFDDLPPRFTGIPNA